MLVEFKVVGSNPGVVHFFFSFLIFFSPFLFSLPFFFSPGFFFSLLLSTIPFKLAPPLQCSSIFLVVHTHASVVLLHVYAPVVQYV